MTSIAICIPWRTDHGQRERLFDWVLPAWKATGFEICVGTDSGEGPINVSQCLNNARKQATTDALVIASADHIPDSLAVNNAVAALGEHEWVPLFQRTAGITQQATDRLLEGRKISVEGSITSEVPFCTALVAVRADVWDSIGGWDERFYGWGCEDTAFRMVLETLYPDPPHVPPRRTVSLWHLGASRDRFDANAELLGGYIAASGSPEAMREYLATR